MKFIICILSVITLLSGCKQTSDDLDSAMELRRKLLVASCSFTADVTANYGDNLYKFRMDCIADADGAMSFTVTEPVSITGITGSVSADRASLTFDDAVLSFPALSGGKLSPVIGPWVFVNTIRSGYLSACGREGSGYRIIADDSYADNALHLEILTDNETIPLQADIFEDQQLILTLRISNFIIM